MAKIRIGYVAFLLACVCNSLFSQGCLEDCYTSQIGVTEATGNNDGPEVEMYLESAGFGPGYSWCASFVNWCHVSCGYNTPNGPAWSPSWFPKSKVIYSPSERILEALPASGDVFGIWYQNKGRIAHVGFIQTWGRGKYFDTVEGNTSNGVYRKVRLKSQAYKVSRWHD